jgi:anti-anti-sigma regulatory factor
VADASRVEDLQPGDHACLTFSDSEERLDLVAAFVRDGLRHGQKVICLTDSIAQSALQAELVERGLPIRDAIGTGQMDLAPSTETYLAGGAFAAARTLATLTGHIESARRDGFEGLRITSDMCWALRPVTGVDELMVFESQVGRLLADGRATAVCQYDRQCFDTVTLAQVTAHHDLAVAAITYHDDGLLRICRQHVPPGVRVAGEIDYRGIEPLTRALAEALALDEHIHVNLTQLSFIDGSAAGALMQAAASLPAGRRMSIRCGSQTAKILRVLGVAHLSDVRLVVTDDD